MDFGEVLARAWQIIWKHKVLWIFGILASCGSAGGGGGNARTSYRGELPPEVERFFLPLERIPDWQIAMFVGIAILVILLLVVLAIFLSTIGRVGLIRGTRQVEAGAESLPFGELFRGSLPYFWRVFLLNLIVGLAVFAVISMVVLVVLFGTVFTLGIGALCLIPLICLLIPAVWFVNVVLEQATIAIVSEDLGIMAGLQRGWEVITENLGAIIVMALILTLGIGLLGGFIIGLPIFLIVAPAVIGALLAESRDVFVGDFFITGLCLVAYLPVAIVLNGILHGYIESAWTLTFLRLTGESSDVLELETGDASVT